jgi:hypothetical protein
MEDRTRMWVECDRSGDGVGGFRALDYQLHYFLMTEMESVKNTERQHRRPHNVGVLGAVKYFHTLSVAIVGAMS